MRKLFLNELLDRKVWITVPEFAEHTIFSTTIIRKKIVQYLNKTHTEGIVRPVTLPNGRQVYFINKNKLKLFSELTGLTLRQDTEKNDKWLDSNDIFKFAYGSKHIIKTLIHKYAQTHPNAVQYKIINGKKESCLSVENKDDFIKTYNLQVRTGKEWLSTYDLKKQFTAQYYTVLKHVKTLAPQYPSEIQYVKRGSNIILCVRYDFVNDFAKLTNLQTYTSKEKKTKNWLNADEICKVAHKDRYLILNNIRQLYAQNDPLVSLKFKTKRWVLCVHKKNLKKFLVQTGILTKITQKQR